MDLRQKVLDYVQNNGYSPTFIAFSAGLYPMIYIYSKNFSLVNSIEHFLFFLFSFLAIPILIFNAVQWLLKRIKKEKYTLFALTLLNVFTFLYLIKIIIYSGPERKKTVVVILIALIFAFFLRTHLKRLVILQCLLAFIGLFTLGSVIYSNLSISDAWQKQPDDILSVQFKKTPNIYVIQPDGYVNFSELEKGYYKFDNSEFESYLLDNDFVNYSNFRSNYPTTLSSNSSLFMMRHHYYNKRIADVEIYNARDIIISKNPVLEILKNNNYKTHLITQTGYMLFNRPKMGYDYCNFKYSDFPFINPGIKDPIDIKKDLKQVITRAEQQPKFVFVEMLKPWHIKSRKTSSKMKVKERQNWLKSLEEANSILRYTIELIKKHDGNALIVIASDHGAYVGFDYARESNTMTKDRDLIYSIFSSQLSICYPDNKIPKFNNEFKTTVNLFRLIFSYLSEDEALLKNLQHNISYKVLRDGVEPGIYEYINENGDISLEALKAEK